MSVVSSWRHTSLHCKALTHKSKNLSEDTVHFVDLNVLPVWRCSQQCVGLGSPPCILREFRTLEHSTALSSDALPWQCHSAHNDSGAVRPSGIPAACAACRPPGAARRRQGHPYLCGAFRQLRRHSIERVFSFIRLWCRKVK